MVISKLSFLNRVENLIKDFCGSVSEDAIRNNFILVYEILDEIVDFGYFQSETSEEILPYIYQQPQFKVKKKRGLKIFEKGTIRAEESTAPIQDYQNRNDIFVDICQTYQGLFQSDGQLIHQ